MDSILKADSIQDQNGSNASVMITAMGAEIIQIASATPMPRSRVAMFILECPVRLVFAIIFIHRQVQTVICIRVPANMRVWHPPQHPVWIVLRDVHRDVSPGTAISLQVDLMNLVSPCRYPGGQLLKAYLPGVAATFHNAGRAFHRMAITGFRVYQMNIAVLLIADAMRQPSPLRVQKIDLDLWIGFLYFIATILEIQLNMKDGMRQ